MLTTINAAPVMTPSTPVAAEPTRKVVVLLADAPTQAALHAWATAQGFDLGASFGGERRDPAQFEFHLTLFATVGGCDLAELSTAIDPVRVEILGFALLGADADTPVLKVASDGELTLLREAWLQQAGAEPTYPDFRPHVSLSYAWDGEPVMSELEMPDFTLWFDRLEVRTLDAPATTSTKSLALDPGIRRALSGYDGAPELMAEHDRLVAELELLQAGGPLSPQDMDIVTEITDRLDEIEDALLALM